jgi:predicted GNAT family N-acyltransferase
VFVLEQRVPADLERDPLDPDCRHVLARDATGRPIGTGRLTPDGRIGRMAVLRERRGQGVGAALLEALLEVARARGLPEVHLHAQQHARGFYARHGFEVEGSPFEEAGIPHIGMRMKLVPA